MAVPAQDTSGRLKNVTIVKPVVYGNIARYFGKKRDDDGHTHQWTVYVKPYRNEIRMGNLMDFVTRHGCLESYGQPHHVEIYFAKRSTDILRTRVMEGSILKHEADIVDMSAYVKKINFKLHDSYPNPNRVVSKPPYEVTETGWGEFEIIIKIYFNDPAERPVTIYHLLKLFQSETDVMLGKKSLVVEYYDEIVFQDPTLTLHSMLTNTPALTIGPYKHETDFEEKRERTQNKIINAHSKIRCEIDQLNEKLKKSKDVIAKMKKDIGKLEEGLTIEADVPV